jgi:hypothetical protein
MEIRDTQSSASEERLLGMDLLWVAGHGESGVKRYRKAN